jgi:hypothetical protein
MSRQGDTRGTLSVGKLADMAVLSADYFSVSDEEIKSLESVLTILGGKPVYAAEEFSSLDPEIPSAMPDWSPVHTYPGYWKPDFSNIQAHAPGCGCSKHTSKTAQRNPFNIPQWMLGPRGLMDGGCECFAF